MQNFLGHKKSGYRNFGSHWGRLTKGKLKYAKLGIVPESSMDRLARNLDDLRRIVPFAYRVISSPRLSAK